jgi:hypothetical protein
MASLVTNRGRKRLAELALKNEYNDTTPPTNFYAHLITDVTGPTVDTDAMSGFTVVAVAGYSAQAIPRSDSGWDTFYEDDGNDEAYAQAADFTYSPSADMNGVYHCLLGESATFGSAECIVSWDLSGPVNVSGGQDLTIQDAEINFTLPAA